MGEEFFSEIIRRPIPLGVCAAEGPGIGRIEIEDRTCHETYRTYIPEQSLLLPPSVRDWLAEDHLSYFISDAVDAMDLSAFEQRYGTDGPGNQAYDPRMMVKVLIYGYATGVFSSRKIAAKLTDDVAFRMLGAENFPAHRTISDFRKLHLEEFGNLFVQVVMMAREAGLVKMGTVAVDGTKMRANASKRKAMSWKSVIGPKLKSRSFSRQDHGDSGRPESSEHNDRTRDVPCSNASPDATAWERANSISASIYATTLLGEEFFSEIIRRPIPLAPIFHG